MTPTGSAHRVRGVGAVAVRPLRPAVERQAVVRGSSGGADPMTEIYDSIRATSQHESAR